MIYGSHDQMDFGNHVPSCGGYQLVNYICEHTDLIVTLMISRQCDNGCSQLNGVRNLLLPFCINRFVTCQYMLLRARG
jgi:hypothetical protein